MGDSYMLGDDEEKPSDKDAINWYIYLYIKLYKINFH